MNAGLTPAEARFVRALYAGGPMGIAARGLSRMMGISAGTVRNLAALVEQKGFCTRERYGMRVFLRPTPLALALVVPAEAEDPAPAFESTSASRPVRSRAPRMARGR
jgi:DNA-binding MarR family transcriptional regulator